MTTVMNTHVSLDSAAIASAILGGPQFPRGSIPKDAWAKVVDHIINTVVIDSPGWVLKPQSIKKLLEEDGKAYGFRSFERVFTSAQVQAGLPKGVAPQEVYFEIAHLDSLPHNEKAKRMYQAAHPDYPDGPRYTSAGYERTFKVLLGRKGRLFVLRALWKPEWERVDHFDGEHRYYCKGVRLLEVTPEQLFSMRQVEDSPAFGEHLMLGFFHLAKDTYSAHRYRADDAARKLERMRAIGIRAGLLGLE
jgi:hypothetical protein